MSAVGTMPSSHAGTLSSSTQSPPELHDRLDTLWTSYLRHLDAYTSAQETLQKYLRSGFFSLSRANFNARPGMRHGQDYFHDRAIATRRVEIKRSETNDQNERFQLSIVYKQPVPSAEEDGVASEEKAVAKDEQQQPSPPATPESTEKTKPSSDTESDANLEESDEKSDGAAAKSATSKPPLEADPLRWFGILIPRELRLAQSSFAAAIDEGISDAVNAGRAMREIEFEIRKLRKEIRKAEKFGKI